MLGSQVGVDGRSHDRNTSHVLTAGAIFGKSGGDGAVAGRIITEVGVAADQDAFDLAGGCVEHGASRVAGESIEVGQDEARIRDRTDFSVSHFGRETGRLTDDQELATDDGGGALDRERSVVRHFAIQFDQAVVGACADLFALDDLAAAIDFVLADRRRISTLGADRESENETYVGAAGCVGNAVTSGQDEVFADEGAGAECRSALIEETFGGAEALALAIALGLEFGSRAGDRDVAFVDECDCRIRELQRLGVSDFVQVFAGVGSVDAFDVHVGMRSHGNQAQGQCGQTNGFLQFGIHNSPLFPSYRGGEEKAKFCLNWVSPFESLGAARNGGAGPTPRAR